MIIDDDLIRYEAVESMDLVVKVKILNQEYNAIIIKRLDHTNELCEIVRYQLDEKTQTCPILFHTFDEAKNYLIDRNQSQIVRYSEQINRLRGIQTKLRNLKEE